MTSVFSLHNDRLELRINRDGTQVALEDRRSGQVWRLDESTRLIARDLPRFEEVAYQAESLAAKESPVRRTGAGIAEQIADNEIRCVHRALDGKLALRWILEKDRIRVIAEAEGITACSLPGTFRPPDGAGFLSAIANCQGVLHTGKGPAFYRGQVYRGHLSMAMFGQMTARGGLLTIAETDCDAIMHWEKDGEGKINLMWMQHPSLGTFSYARETVLLATEPNLTALCKTYRRYVIEKGRFKNWEQKIAERPVLEKLFGAAVVFTGYVHNPKIDYAAGFRRLKQLGIDKAYVYPVYMKTIDTDQGLPYRWNDYRQLKPLLDELGYAGGSFILSTEGPMGEGDDPHRDLALNAKGEPQVRWRMEHFVWYAISLEKRFEWSKKFIDEQTGLDGVHYDVNCADMSREDFHPKHRNDARAERELRRRLLDYAASKGKIVSSEGFWDAMTPHYDLGSSKYALALGGDEYCIVPMTMLVYHDCTIHSWWEPDNYNNPLSRSQVDRGYFTRFPMGGGFPRHQSAMDALMGTPPDIFPFGTQPNYIPQNRKDLFLYGYTLEHPFVTEAIEYAKPVMALHRKIGKLEMMEHRLHHPDGAVQETVFSDGTRVVANFSNVPLEAPDAGLLPAESWKVL